MVSHWKKCLLWLVIALLCQLLAAQQLQGPPRPRGRIRIADMQPPAGPVSGPGPLGNWPSLPAVGPISSTVHTHIPLLREESAQRPLTPSQEAVVYGNWKPEHPEKPEELAEKDKEAEMEMETDSSQQPRERVYGRLEAMLMGLPANTADSKLSSSSEEQTAPIAPGSYQNPVYAPPASYERSPEKHGRKRITSQQTPHQFEVTRVNNTDPALKAVAKQINESAETTTTTRRNTQSTTDDTWMPLPYPYPYDTTMPSPPASSSMIPGFMQSSVVHPPAPTQATHSTAGLLNWPTDFIDSTSNTASTERIDGTIPANIDRRDDSISDSADDYKYYEESLNSAQMHSELSVPETLPLNITRVGIPYEDRNASEEPTICVPLTVSEASLSSDSVTPLVVEVERVYCFPLPKVEVRRGQVRPQVEQVTRTHQEEEELRETEMQPTDQAMPPMDVAAGASRSSVGVLALSLLLVGWSLRPGIST
ncbi:uncharacterized protein [Drosophila kikkawai]|uniref:Flocculation protein FLO11 n=1 Tax=Drosophila kikkawai TaxID=30033 RepID=A0A6P4JC70_DROKI|nr:uncharacterized protein LOC108082311 [Drosophila kikkawai]